MALLCRINLPQYLHWQHFPHTYGPRILCISGFSVGGSYEELHLLTVMNFLRTVQPCKMIGMDVEFYQMEHRAHNNLLLQKASVKLISKTIDTM